MLLVLTFSEMTIYFMFGLPSRFTTQCRYYLHPFQASQRSLSTDPGIPRGGIFPGVGVEKSTNRDQLSEPVTALSVVTAEDIKYLINKAMDDKL